MILDSIQDDSITQSFEPFVNNSVTNNYIPTVVNNEKCSNVDSKNEIKNETQVNQNYISKKEDKYSYGFINIFIVLSLLAITLITFVIF